MKLLAPLLLIALVLIVVGASLFLIVQFVNPNFPLSSFSLIQPLSPSQLLHNGTPDYEDFGNVLVLGQTKDNLTYPTRLQVRGVISKWLPDSVILQVRTRQVIIHLLPLTPGTCLPEYIPNPDGTYTEVKTTLVDHSQSQETLSSYSSSFLRQKIAPEKTITVITRQEGPDRWIAEKIIGYGCALNL